MNKHLPLTSSDWDLKTLPKVASWIPLVFHPLILSVCITMQASLFWIGPDHETLYLSAACWHSHVNEFIRLGPIRPAMWRQSPIRARQPNVPSSAWKAFWWGAESKLSSLNETTIQHWQSQIAPNATCMDTWTRHRMSCCCGKNCSICRCCRRQMFCRFYRRPCAGDALMVDARKALLNQQKTKTSGL